MYESRNNASISIDAIILNVHHNSDQQLEPTITHWYFCRNNFFFLTHCDTGPYRTGWSNNQNAYPIQHITFSYVAMNSKRNMNTSRRRQNEESIHSPYLDLPPRWLELPTCLCDVGPGQHLEPRPRRLADPQTRRPRLSGGPSPVDETSELSFRSPSFSHYPPEVLPKGENV